MLKNTRDLKVLHIIASSEIKAGGTFIAASNLSDALLSFGVSCQIIAQKYSDDKKIARSTATPVTFVQSTKLLNTGYSSKLKSTILKLSKDVDIIHAHGVWTCHLLCASSISRIKGIPFIITPHGMLEPWILSRGKFKKRIAAILYHNDSLRRSTCLHALTINEMHNLRELEIGKPIAVIPNGTDRPRDLKKVGSSKLSGRFPALNDKKVILFLSRIHPKKGLLNLLEALKRTIENSIDWHLVIAGPDEQGHLKVVHKKILDLCLDSHVTIVGSVADEEKAHLYSISKAFVLPSFSEGFSMSILEAMSYGMPCLYTEQCNFPKGGEWGAAFIGLPTVDSISDMLAKLFSLTDNERIEMGAKGKLLISKFYTWESVAEKTYDLYMAIIEDSKMPDFVYF